MAKRLTFDSPVGTITTVPLDDTKAQEYESAAKAAGAKNVKLTEAK